MIDTIPNLWPDSFKVDVQTPYSILRAQAELLGNVTRGILKGAVETEEGKERIQHRLVVIAPAYNGYRHTLITASHHTHFPYPTEVRAESLAERVRGEPIFGPLASGPMITVYPKANNDDEMRGFVQRALRSGPTMAAVLSLIANSNQAKGMTAGSNGSAAENLELAK